MTPQPFQKLIILRVCMGSGKSTVARRYRSFERKFALIQVDKFKELFDHFERPARSVVHGAANASLEYLLQSGFSVVMEGVFQNPVFIEKAREIAQKHNVPCKVFELTASLRTLQVRDRQRDEVKRGLREPLGDEAIEHIFNKLRLHPSPLTIELNTEEMSVEDLIAFIDKAFEKDARI